MPTLLQKLKNLGVHLGVDTIANPQKAPYPIDQVFKGELETGQRGEVFTYRVSYPLPYLVGNEVLDSVIDPSPICAWADVPACDIDRIAFVDTETSGLAGGTGTFIFLFGLCHFSESRLNVQQIFMTDPASEGPFLERIARESARFSTFVSYNGKAFDLPIIKSRCVMNSVPDVASSICQIDLLHLARRIWKLRLPDRSLKEIETNVLGFHRSLTEIPGYLVPSYYTDFLRTQDARPLKGVFYHNEMDIINLSAIFSYLSQFMLDPFNRPAPEGLDVIALARLHEARGNQELSLSLYEKGINLPIDRPNYLKALFSKANIHKARMEFREAVSLWKKASRLGHLPSMIELAKYYENIARDLVKADAWVNRALEMLDRDPPPEYLKQKDEINKRNRRIARKIKAS